MEQNFYVSLFVAVISCPKKNYKVVFTAKLFYHSRLMLYILIYSENDFF